METKFTPGTTLIVPQVGTLLTRQLIRLSYNLVQFRQYWAMVASIHRHKLHGYCWLIISCLFVSDTSEQKASWNTHHLGCETCRDGAHLIPFKSIVIHGYLMLALVFSITVLMLEIIFFCSFFSNGRIQTSTIWCSIL